ncbi:hypothetical protein AOLI_G00322260 [Acnodon oligacanthus]
MYQIKMGRSFVVVHRDWLAPAVTPVPEISAEIPSFGHPVLEVRNRAEHAVSGLAQAKALLDFQALKPSAVIKGEHLQLSPPARLCLDTSVSLF